MSGGRAQKQHRGKVPGDGFQAPCFLADFQPLNERTVKLGIVAQVYIMLIHVRNL